LTSCELRWLTILDLNPNISMRSHPPKG
jgi:hypothetical protein